MGIARGIVRGTVRGVVRGVVCQVNPLDYRLRTEGDSLMAGAYGFSVNASLAALLPELSLSNTAVGGSTIDQVKDRVINGDAILRNRTTIFWDGWQNGLTTVAAYVDLLADAIAALPHSRFVVIPPLNRYGSTYAGSEAESIATEMQSRWPNNFLHWTGVFENTDGSVARVEFADPDTDTIHLSEAGCAHMAYGIWQYLKTKGLAPNIADPMLSAGSVWLADFGLAEGQFSGIPIDGQIVPNIAAETAAALAGESLSDAHRTIITVVDTDDDVTIERTPNLGLHAILSQSDYTQAAQGVMVQPNTSIQSYIDASTSDEWYFSLWWIESRAPAANGTNGPNTSPQPPMLKANNTGNYLFYYRDQSSLIFPGSGDNFIGSYESNTGTLLDSEGEPSLKAVATTGYTGTQLPLVNGGIGPSSLGLEVDLGSLSAWAYSNRGAAPSRVLYRAFAENLTASGRTWAQVSAMEKVLFAEAFAGLGRFASDTYSDPDVVYP